MIRLSVIIPTLGRPTLGRMLESVQPQMGPEDEIVLLCDGPEVFDRLHRLQSLPRFWVWHRPTVDELRQGPGNTQRNSCLDQHLAEGDYLLWGQDDDIYLPGALDAVRAAAEKHPGRPLMFRMHAWWGETLWRPSLGMYPDELLRVGNVSDQMFIAPNIPEKLGRFTNSYEGDFAFISETVKLHGGPWSLVWRPEVIARCRP